MTNAAFRGGGVREPLLGRSERNAPPDRQCNIAADLRRRREASWRLPPLPCGCPDPLGCRHYDDEPCQDDEPEPLRVVPFVMLSAALGALRRAWSHADADDQVVLADIAAVLRSIAESGEVA